MQLQEVEDNSQFVEQREREIHLIVRSIQDLNEVFKDLATMIVDQVRNVLQNTLCYLLNYNVTKVRLRSIFIKRAFTEAKSLSDKLHNSTNIYFKRYNHTV